MFTYIWLICMINVGKYTIPYMDPMGNVEIIKDLSTEDFNKPVFNRSL